MKRVPRFLLHALLPAPLATLVMFLPAALNHPAEWLFAAVVYLIPAYIIAGLPSLGYAWLMERAYARGLPAGGWGALALSTLLGGCSGLLIVGALGLLSERIRAAEISYLVGIGAGVGALIGLIIRRIERLARSRSGVITPPAPTSGP